ncbi:MAG: cysteine desulfurase CsdA [Gammaproteobacteria bacterium]|nr:cysteine desulfurase CsdA [Gammaproteobacteria bacterium]
MSKTNIRGDFPILATSSRGKPLTYLDNAATTQKPQCVIDAIGRYYATFNANVHRAAHEMAEKATAELENTRGSCAQFLNARSIDEIIFTKGTTESINLVANSVPTLLKKRRNIVISELEHHSNIVPWQLLAERHNLDVVAIGISDNGELDLEQARSLINEDTALIAITHVSNGLGVVNDVKAISKMAREHGALYLVDGAQSALHFPINVEDIDCDFFVFSGHKLFGPTGIGVLWGRRELLEKMTPWQGGGEMIEKVSIASSTYQQPPFKFEAGTPNIAGAIGLGAALKYLEQIDRSRLGKAQDILVNTTVERLADMPRIRLIGNPNKRSAIISFLIENSHPNDIGTLLDQQGIALRTGHHCNMPLMDRLQIPGTIRASFSLYNDEKDGDRLISGIEKAKTFL